MSLFVKNLTARLLFLTFIWWSFLSFASGQEAVAASRAEKAYQHAEATLKKFARSKKIKYRRYWLEIISKFKSIYLRYPESAVAPKALYRTGRLYEELYGYSGKRKDLIQAVRYYRLLWERYPESPQAKLALKRAVVIYEKKFKDPVTALALKKELKKLASVSRETKRKASAQKVQKPAKQETPAKNESTKVLAFKLGGTVKQVRYWSGKDYSRVVVDLTRNVKYKPHVLKAHAGKPPRLYVDIRPAKISPYVKPAIPIQDGLLKQVRLGQYRRDTVRVVLDLASLTDYRVFFLNSPPRLVIDLVGHPAKKKGCPPPPKIINGDISLAQQLGLCINRIVIDPGHGGKDPGCRRGRLKEKHIVLEVSKRLAAKLKKRLGCEVVLTRNRDVFIPLEQRTAIANMKGADLFISVHVNSSPNRRAYGLETYYLNFASDEEAMRVAALENAASTHSMSELQDLLKGILLNTKLEESQRLAEAVQKNLVSCVKKRYRYVKDRGVRTAPFIVLIGTRMPAVLVEIGFVSNKMEYRRLQSPKYLDLVADGIARGIEEYVRQMKIAATP
ncbi:N-acetylmuramoyl-L-alanine amidase [Thermodesulfatator atlanticus]|uniref:N-acetylmuramoyl-L-alanine amidase n=1 Tax=Thermodesulfatator atlanticus TaxID=501497 RepID=UPI0003B41CDF|nr:N-acetylmuramoyl-L-alanine amidase [Thermodesulfatator atlanticus]